MSAPRVPGGNPADPFPIVNQGLDNLAHQQVFSIDPDTTAGLTWGYLGTDESANARWGGFTISTGTLSLSNNAENYIVVERSTGAISVSTSTTNWNNLTGYARVFHLTTASGVVTTIRDYRGGTGGVHGQADLAASTAALLITEAGSNRDFATTDAGAYVRFTGTGAKTASFDVADSFAAPQEYHIVNRAASGNLTLTPTGITLNAPKGGTLVLEPGDSVTVKFVDTDEADVMGSTEPA